jgi:hypothetical protein
MTGERDCLRPLTRFARRNVRDHVVPIGSVEAIFLLRNEQTLSTVRAAALRSKCLSLAKTCSMGLGRVSISEEQSGFGRTDELSDSFAFVAAEIVHEDDASRL